MPQRRRRGSLGTCSTHTSPRLSHRHRLPVKSRRRPPATRPSRSVRTCSPRPSSGRSRGPLQSRCRLPPPGDRPPGSSSDSRMPIGSSGPVTRSGSCGRRPLRCGAPRRISPGGLRMRSWPPSADIAPGAPGPHAREAPRRTRGASHPDWTRPARLTADGAASTSHRMPHAPRHHRRHQRPRCPPRRCGECLALDANHSPHRRHGKGSAAVRSVPTDVRPGRAGRPAERRQGRRRRAGKSALQAAPVDHAVSLAARSGERAHPAG